jgi:hypothetical protein
MTGNPLYFPIFRAFDSNGDPLAFGKVYTYAAGTSTPKDTYTTASLGTPNANPVILDAEGYPDSGGIWLDGSYKIDLYDADDVQQDGFPVDNFQNDSGAAGPAGTFQMATAGGTVDAITATYSPVVTLSNLTCVGFVASGANTSTTPTFAPDGLTAHTITKKGGVALRAGDIPGALAVCLVEYNSANTRWELLNPASEIYGTEQTIASATTTDLGTKSTNNILISGTTTITGFGSSASTTQPIYFIRFSGALTLTHNATSLILPGSANITTANGDTAIAEYLGTSNWKVLSYTSISAAPAGTTANSLVKLDATAKLPAVDGSQLTGIKSTTQGTAVNTTSGTSVTIATGLSSTVKRFTLTFEGVSTNGTSNPIIQLGTGGGPTYVTSGYLGASANTDGAPSATNFTAGAGIDTSAAADIIHGSITFSNHSGNSWAWQGVLANSNTARGITTAGSVPLGAALTAVRITTVGGVDTFDAGSINILYELG